MVKVVIDGATQYFNGVSSVTDAIDQINEKLGVEAKTKRMAFEVRGTDSKGYGINKKGDSEYRRLKTFKTAKEALDYRNSNYDDLVAAWEDVKNRDNVKKDDVRGESNRPRTAEDYRQGTDISTEQFQSTFGFRGGQFGKWVSQGSNAKERQWMLNSAYDALMDLSNILNIPPKAISLNGELGMAFGARGSGAASAHYESDTLVINLTKTRGAGTLAHEWFHALDNYFQRTRGALMDNKRESRYITYAPEAYYEKADGTKMPVKDFDEAVAHDPIHRMHNQDAETRKIALNQRRIENKAWWKTYDAVRPEVEAKFAELVQALNESPMTARASIIDKGKADGYWSRIIERAARSFENYVIAKMAEKGYHNDYLANVVNIAEFKRDAGRYPYLKEEELAPVVEAFDNLFGELKTKETDQGTALFNTHPGASIPKSEWLSVGAIVEEVDQLLEPFATEIPVLVRDTLADIGVKTADDGVTSGVVYGGRIHLFRDGMSDRSAVARTLWHELLHFGFRRFMTEPQYIVKMGELYIKDGWVRGKANAWMQSTEAKELAKTKKPGYVLARGVDEALAELAEIMQTEPTGYRNNTKLAQAKRAVSEWVAKMADFFGFKEAAQAWRGYAAQKDARDLIVSTFAKLREGAPPSSLNTQWHYSDPAFMVAWHGSPHDHDKFDSAKIGTGEGAQAYGHGLYFASNREVAEWYRNNLNSQWVIDGEPLRGVIGISQLAKSSIALSESLDDAILYLKSDTNLGSDTVNGRNLARAIDWIEKNRGRIKKTGAIYQVELAPSADEYLDWDKPLGEQSEKVKAALREAGLLEEYRGNEWLKDTKRADLAMGGDLYHALTGHGIKPLVTGIVGARSASEYLKSIGIHGIRYLDGSSRSVGEGSSNYVIFDDNDVSITDKFSRNSKDNIGDILNAVNSRDNHLHKAHIGKPSAWLIAQAKEDGLDIDGFEHEVDTFAVRHIIKNHGDSARERARGQVEVTQEDILNIPDVLLSPDKVAFGTKNRIGRDQIVYLKKMPDGSTLYFEEVRKGNKELAAVTMRKYPATMNAADILETLDPNARSDGGMGLIIHDVPENVSAVDIESLNSRNVAESGLPVSRIQSIVDQITAKLPRLSGVVHVVQSTSELPGGGLHSDIEGAYIGSTGKIYLVADNLPTESRLRKVLAHEAVGHLSMEEMLGAVDPKLWDKLVNQISLLEKSGNKLVVSIGKTVDERQPGLSWKNRVEEILAIMAEEGIQNDPLFIGAVRTTFQRFIDGIKAFMKLVFDVQMTDKEVLDIVKMAERHLSEKAGESSVVSGMKEALASRANQDKPGVTFDGTEMGGKSQPINQLVFKARLFARKMFADKTVTAGDGHEVTIPWSGIKHTFSGKVSANAAIVASKLDKVIENGKLIRTVPDKSGRGTIKAVHTYETPVSIGGEPVTIHIIVREARDGRRFYDHYEVKETAPSGMSGEHLEGESIRPTLGAAPSEPGTLNIAEEGAEGNPDIRFSRSSIIGDSGREHTPEQIADNNASWEAPEASNLATFVYRILDKHIDLKQVQQAIKEKSGQIKDAIKEFTAKVALLKTWTM